MRVDVPLCCAFSPQPLWLSPQASWFGHETCISIEQPCSLTNPAADKVKQQQYQVRRLYGTGGLAVCGMAWHGMAWRQHGLHGMAWHGVAWHDVAWHGMVWHGMAARMASPMMGQAWHGITLACTPLLVPHPPLSRCDRWTLALAARCAAPSAKPRTCCSCCCSAR